MVLIYHKGVEPTVTSIPRQHTQLALHQDCDRSEPVPRLEGCLNAKAGRSLPVLSQLQEVPDLTKHPNQLAETRGAPQMYAVLIPKISFLVEEAGSRPGIFNSTGIFVSFPGYIASSQRAPIRQKDKKKTTKKQKAKGS